MPFCPVCSFVFGDEAIVCPHDGVLLVASDPLVGQTLDGKYRIDARLGAGGMGAVYAGTQIALQRRVAIKVILGASSGVPLAVRRFEREALAVARLRHPHIVAVHDYGVATGVGAFLVMEFLEGRSLRDEIKARGRVPVDEALEWFAQICAAVNAAHVAGLIHRDLKPENIVLESADDKRFAKVLDFGIAKFLSENEPAGTPLTGSGGIIGTPYYMSPEQCRGEMVSPASDVYALGCVLYEVLTGRPPFEGMSTPALLYQHVSVTPAPPSSWVREIPASVDGAILKAMAKDPADRFESATEFRTAVAAAKRGDSIETLPLADGIASEGLAGASLRVPNNLPAEVSRFVGREVDAAELRRLLRESRLVTVTGAGGIGKTRLIARVATTLLDKFADGVWLVELGSLTDPAHVDRAVASVFGLGDETGRSSLDVLLGHLRNRRVLLVVDNCEHLIDASAAVTSALLRGCPGLTVLASSREPLAIDGETVYQLDPLSLGASVTARTAAHALESEAVRLFVDRAQSARPTWVFADDDAFTVAKLCERLDGIPLAIELAAARVTALPVAQILERIGGQSLLSGGGRSVPARHRTLAATIEWSYNLLSDEERGLLQRVAAFTGGWTLDAAEAVATDNDLEVDEVLPLLANLVKKSLVVMDERDYGARYRMLETIRSFCLDRLRASSDADIVAARHRDWVILTVEGAFVDFGGADHERWHRIVSDEHANALAALTWGRGHAESADANLRLAVGLGAFWETYGYWRLGRQWLEECLASSPHSDDVLRARAHFRLATLAHRQGTYSDAEKLYRACLDLLHGTDPSRMMAEALTQLGRVVGAVGRLEDEREILLEAVAMHRATGTPITIASALHALGESSRQTGDYADADRWLDESLDLFRRAEFSQGISVAQIERAKVALAIGDPGAALERAMEALSVARSGEFGILVVQGQRIVAEALLAQNEWMRARTAFGDALRLAQDLGAVEDILFTLEGFARTFAHIGDPHRALVLLTVAARHRTAANDPLPMLERDDVERLEKDLRERLDDDEVRKCEVAAAGMSLDDAVSQALGGTGNEAETLRQ